MSRAKYNHIKTEGKWQKKWEENKIYQTLEGVSKDNKYYILPQLPYPSGSGLHVGHAETYIACDIYARFQRMTGKKVLQVMGWDAFGLPAENFAIKNNVHPRVNTDKAIDNFRKQIKALGISVDWSREVGSHNPDYYKWTQWFFLLMYERGLAYRKKQRVNWCPSCKTVLANEQVVDGVCERCSHEVIQKEMEQWFFKITEYADRLAKDLDKVDWPKETIRRQREWIGQSDGAEIAFDVLDHGEKKHKLIVFTTAHDTIYGSTFMVVAPEHQLIQTFINRSDNPDEVRDYVKKASVKTELQRQKQAEKTGVKIKGFTAVNPVNGKEIPIFVADYVIVEYGHGAIMSVPGHDERDFEYAKKYNIEIVYLVENEGIDFANYSEIKKNADTYIVKNSDEFNGMTFKKASAEILKKLEKSADAKTKVEYKLRDWSVSRQRFWGAPIPMVYDDKNKLHPVKKEDLPVILPDDVDFKPTGQSPLTYSDSFQDGVEQKYGKDWRREVDTLDTFMCSSWYYYRYLDPHNDKAFASEESLKKWMPVDFYLGGIEHVNGHLLYSRFFTKVLYDAGYIDFDEPFSVHRHQGTILGEDNRKMSKRWGNVVNPTDVVEKYGADTARVYEMFMGPLEQSKAWNDNAVAGVRRFIVRIFNLASDDKKSQAVKSSKDLEKLLHKTVKIVTSDTKKLKYNTAIARFMEFTNLWMKPEEMLDNKDTETLLKLLAPYAPHITEELWVLLGNKTSIHLEKWPSYDKELVREETTTIVVQVNGKVRATLTINEQEAKNKEQVLQYAKEDDKVRKYLDGKEIKKEIFVPGKLVNFVI